MARGSPWFPLVVVSISVLPSHAQHPLSVGVFMEFDSKLSNISLDVMEKEVDKLLEASGVSLEWRLAKENRGEESYSNLVFLKFRGTCRLDTGRQGSAGDFGTLGETRALGSTKVTHGRVMPFTEVECDRIRDAVAAMTPGGGQKERQHALGVALGRVVAHELYHVFAKTTGHAAKGLAKATQSIEDLLSSREMEFRAEDSLAMRMGLSAFDSDAPRQVQ